MGSTYYSWYATNAARPFPLDDAADGVDDDGVELPDDLLVDLSLAWPADDPDVPFVSGLTVGTAATVAVSVRRLGGDVEPVASVTAATVSQGRSVALADSTGRVVGRVTFGRAAVTGPVRSYRFSRPEQSGLAARCLRLYRRSGIAALRKHGASGELTGLMTASAGSDLKVSVGTRLVQERQVTGLVIGLDVSGTSLNLFERYVGDCGRRPESGNCTVPPVEFLQTVSPDCDGNVNLVFAPPMTYVTTPGLIVVDLAATLGDVCVTRLPDADGNLPGFPSDSNNLGDDPDPYPGGGDTPTPPDPIEISSTSIDCSTLPYCGIVGEGVWQEVSGVWVSEYAYYPHCPDGSSSSLISATSAALEPHLVCSSTDVRGLLVWYDCGYTDALNLRAETVVMVGGVGTAGVLLGYAYDGSVDTYLAVELDTSVNRLVVRRWNGFGYITIATSGPLTLPTLAWYRVWGRTVGGLTGPVTVSAGVGPADGPDLVTLTTSTNNFPRTGGKLGVTSSGAVNGFGYFSVE